MKAVSKSEFFRRFASGGPILDPRYASPQTLVFPGDERDRCSWTWDLPGNLKELPFFVAELIDAVDAKEAIYIFPREGAWRSGSSSQMFQVRSICRACGVDPSDDDVLVASIGERDAVDALFLLSLIFGGTVSDDIFLIPDSGDVILYADHHEMVHAEFRSSDVRSRYLPNVRDYEPAQPSATDNPDDAQ